jgi:uncharacterized membrane protein (UPF0127 family)
VTDLTEDAAPDETPRRLAAWWMLAVVIGGGLLAFLVLGANRPDDPSLLDDGSGTGAPASSGRAPLEGFGEISGTVSSADGDEQSVCLLLAETDAQRERGLMEVTDPTLGGYDGMAFVFGEDTSTSFYMRNTPMPLSIAFLAADGQLVSAVDMSPCADVSSCPLYPAGGPYRYAIEVPRGRLPDLGIVAGARVSLGPHVCG